jgi:hypothetical protein
MAVFLKELLKSFEERVFIKCEEYLKSIKETLKKTGDVEKFQTQLENMKYFCEDYDEYK